LGVGLLLNAALNYGYGMLRAQVRQALLLAGLEPNAGFLHADRPGKPSLTLDQIEEFRQGPKRSWWSTRIARSRPGRTSSSSWRPTRCCWRKPGGCRRGFTYSIPLRQSEIVAMTPALRQKVRQTVDVMRAAIAGERMPDAPASRRPCVSCEFRRFCSDVV
jgi:hypothetical protein